MMDLDPVSILLVDDFGTMRRIIRRMLKEIGYNTIEEVDNGLSALTRLKERKFSLIISDWNMEPISGIDLLKAVRADADLADIPFVMLTGEATTNKVIEAQKAGVTIYMVKPFTADTLRTKLLAIL